MEAQVIAAFAEGVSEVPREEPRSVEFAVVYRRHGAPLYATAVRMLRRPEEAEDAVQDAFLAYHRKRPEVPEAELGRWLHRVVVNRCLDRLRRGQRWKDEEVTDMIRPVSPGHDGLNLDLERAVARLPEKARVVFLLHAVEGLKHREIAKLLGLSEGTTKSQVHRARQLLRDFMKRGAS